MIELTEVSKSFGSARAVCEVSFSLEPGTITGFLGPNGAGKTTTMRLITGYLAPDQGKITIQGQEHHKQGVALRACMGYLPEHTPLYGDLTVLEHLRLTGQLLGLSGKQLRQAVTKMVRICDLGERMKQTVGTLSRGLRQRVGLAQAMIHDPDILILDEPTTGLDPNQTAEIKDLIKALGQEKTLLLSTHILEQVPELCDRVLVLSKGRLVFNGSPGDWAEAGSTPTQSILVVDREREEVAALLTPLAPVEGIHQVKREGGFVHYRLNGSFDGDDMAAIFAVLAETSWRISAFHAEPPSLAAIFAGQTTGET